MVWMHCSLEFENKQRFTTNERHRFAEIRHQLNRDGVKAFCLKWHVLQGIESHMFGAVVRLPRIHFSVDDVQTSPMMTCGNRLQ